MLDGWNDFSAAIREGVVAAESVRDANTALRERFATIFAKTEGDTVRLDFVLKERETGAPLVASRLWADAPGAAEAAAAEGFMLVNLIQAGPGPEHLHGVDVTGRDKP